ncbi:MAG TPA: hypothetical protein VJ044_08090, partial [Candidatus Hodarchaeales archaeon]|nr:hypothetical protein [Candidatus Hodarchaeales archaeon]
MELDKKLAIIVRRAISGSKSAWNLLSDSWKNIPGVIDVFSSSKSPDSFIENSALLTIRKLLWHEILLNEIDWKDNLFLVGVFFWNRSLLTRVDLRVLWDKLLVEGMLNPNDLAILSLLLLDPKLKVLPFSLWIDHVLIISSEFGLTVPSFDVIIDIYKESFEEGIPDFWKGCQECIKSILNYPEHMQT